MMSLHPTAANHLLKICGGSSRTFAAAAAASKKASASSPSADNPFHIPREELKVTNVNGINVATVETNKPLAKLAIYIRAGSRFETDATQGVSQMLRICAGLGTEHHSHFGTTRTIEANGGVLTATTGREYVAYTLQTSRNRIEEIEKYIRELASYQTFKPWEVQDNIPRLRLERKIRPPQVRIMELVHKAAYRRGLGYSLYSPKWMIGNHTSEMLNQFVKNNFVEATLVGTGVNHQHVRAFAESLKLSGGSRNVQPSKFHAGSELRKETGADLAYVALAIEGASYTDQKKLATAALVHHALGSGPRTKRGLNLGGKLSGAVGGDDSLKASVSSFNTNYADSGLLGVYIAATPCTVENVVKKSAEILLSGGFTDADLARAKAQLKADIACATDSDDGFLQDVGLQTLLTGSYAGQSEIDALIDSVTLAELNAVAGKGKLSMASFGKIANVPYLDQLKK